MDLEEINKHRRSMGLPEHCAYPSSFRKDDPPRQSLWKVTIRFQPGTGSEANARCNRYKRALRGNGNDWGYVYGPGDRRQAERMYEAWFLVEGSKLQSFEEMLRLDIIRDKHGKGGMHDYRVDLFATV